MRRLGFDTIVQGPASVVVANLAPGVCVTLTHEPAGTDALSVSAEGLAVTVKLALAFVGAVESFTLIV
jgi:hypothetical protein